jgi:hypothetical protein
MKRALRAARAVTVLASWLLLAACAGVPAPDWASSAHASLERFEAAWLRGDARLAQSEFERARRELARTGRPELVAHAELVRCAMRVAGLEFDDCPGFQPLAQDAGAEARAYAAYIAGSWQALDASLLPAQHRSIVDDVRSERALPSIEDPASRMVAAGALLRTGRIRPSEIETAIDTASAQGWRRPLLAWLGVQERRALAAGEADAAARIRRRIELVLE